MSEPRKFPMTVAAAVLFGAVGLVVTLACLAGAAWLMEQKSFSGTIVVPLSTAAVCIGSLFSAFAAAAWKRQHSLVTGVTQGALLAAFVCIAAMLNGTSVEPILLIRIFLILLCGGIGGLSGVVIRERRHTIR